MNPQVRRPAISFDAVHPFGACRPLVQGGWSRAHAVIATAVAARSSWRMHTLVGAGPCGVALSHLSLRAGLAS